MDYSFSIKIFEKIAINHIKQNPETLAFLKKEAYSIFKEKKEIWMNSQNEQEKEIKEFWNEFLYYAKFDLTKYLNKWHYNIANKILMQLYKSNLPYEISTIFSDYIMEISYRISLDDFANELIEEIYHSHLTEKGD